MQILNKVPLYIALMRLHSPTGALLLFFPCSWGITLANPQANWFFFTIFLIASIAMRSAGCIINDIFDRDFDKHVERTKNRPIASGKVSVFEGILIVITLSVIGLMVLLQLNKISIFLGLSSIVLIVLYPLMKRFTFFPQAFLGLTFNYGILIGYSAVGNKLSVGSLTAYFAAIFWTIGYDTIYGFQDIKDDKKIGIKSTAIICEKTPKLFIGGSYCIFILFFSASIYLENLKLSYTSIILALLILLQLFWQIYTLETKSRKNCFTRFKSNIFVGLLILIFMTSFTK